jgi:hypothetical protein
MVGLSRRPQILAIDGLEDILLADKDKPRPEPHFQSSVYPVRDSTNTAVDAMLKAGRVNKNG